MNDNNRSQLSLSEVRILRFLHLRPHMRYWFYRIIKQRLLHEAARSRRFAKVNAARIAKYRRDT